MTNSLAMRIEDRWRHHFGDPLHPGTELFSFC